MRDATRPNVKKRTVLVIDDDSVTVATFTAWFELDGYAVRTAGDGESALREVPDVDAVIVDLRMPILDGLGFLRRLRASGQDVAVVIVTGDYLLDNTVLSEAHGLNANVLLKPVWGDELMALTASLIAGAA